MARLRGNDRGGPQGSAAALPGGSDRPRGERVLEPDRPRGRNSATERGRPLGSLSRARQRVLRAQARVESRRLRSANPTAISPTPSAPAGNAGSLVVVDGSVSTP